MQNQTKRTFRIDHYDDYRGPLSDFGFNFNGQHYVLRILLSESIKQLVIGLNGNHAIADTVADLDSLNINVNNFFGFMSKARLARFPVKHTLSALKFTIEIGFDLENDRFTLKMLGIPYEELQEAERQIQEDLSTRLCRKDEQNDFQGRIKTTKWTMQYKGQDIVLLASYSMSTRFADVRCGKQLTRVPGKKMDDPSLYPIPF